MTLDEAIERLYDLNVGTTPVEEGSPHERPHKPLLLAVFDLIDEGLATAGHIPWSQALRDRFSARFLLVRKHNDQNTPENPFYFLRTHHWAMDRDLIAPAPDHHWHVSKILDPRRSNGEKELIELAGKSVLLPKDPAFHPDEEGLGWRLERLIA